MLHQLPGQPGDIAGEDISSYNIVKAAIKNPDVLPTVWTLFAEEDATLTGFLAGKGLYSKGLRDNMSEYENPLGYRVVKSNHVMIPVARSMKRKYTFVDNGTGKAFVCDAYPDKPGYKSSPFYFWLDSNIARPKQVLQLADITSLIYIYSEEEPEATSNGYRYEGKIVTKHSESFVDPGLMQIGSEASTGMTMYEHDYSETGHMTFPFDGWKSVYMTLQRVGFAYSGTAEAMGASKDWYQFRNSKGENVSSYVDHADKLTLKRMAQYQEFGNVLGRGTVSVDGKIMLHDKRKREILGGDGLIHQDDGAYEYPMNDEWSLNRLEHIMRDIDIRSGKDGKLEVLMGAGWESLSSFHRLMRKEGFVTQNNNVVGDGAEKGVIQDYGFYEVNGVRIIPKRIKFFDQQSTPSVFLSDGTKRSSWDSIFVPIGQTERGENGVELIQLRPMRKGALHGINVGGDGMSSTIDGSRVEVLVQSGIISRVKVARAFRRV